MQPNKTEKKTLLYVFHKTQRLCHSSAALRLCWHLGQTRPRFLPSIYVMMVEKHPLSLSGLVKHRIDLVQPWGTEAGILVTVIPCSSVTQAACPTERAWKAPWWEVNTQIHQPWGSWWFRGNASGALSSVSILVFDLRPPESSGPWECV